MSDKGKELLELFQASDDVDQQLAVFQALAPGMSFPTCLLRLSQCVDLSLYANGLVLNEEQSRAGDRVLELSKRLDLRDNQSHAKRWQDFGGLALTLGNVLVAAAWCKESCPNYTATPPEEGWD